MSEVRVPAQIDYGEGSFPGCGPLISYIFTWQRAETGSMISCGFYRALIPCIFIGQSPLSMTRFYQMALGSITESQENNENQTL